MKDTRDTSSIYKHRRCEISPGTERIKTTLQMIFYKMNRIWIWKSQYYGKYIVKLISVLIQFTSRVTQRIVKLEYQKRKKEKKEGKRKRNRTNPIRNRMKYMEHETKFEANITKNLETQIPSNI